jgi:hypothetical protein
MNDAGLVGVAVSMMVSDPWEFGSECGTGPFLGAITDADADTAIIRLDHPISYGGRSFPTAMAKPRHVGDQTSSVLVKTLPANIVLLAVSISATSEVTPDSRRGSVFVVGTVERR